MRIGWQNQQMLFTVLLCAVIGLVAAHLLEKGIGAAGEKERVLKLAGALSRCTTPQQYLAALEKEYPPDSPLWQSPALTTRVETGPSSPVIERLRDERLRVTVAVMQPEQLITRNAYRYVPAALIVEGGRGFLLEEVRLNSRGNQIVFEYYYRGEATESTGGGRAAKFCLGRRQWILQIP
ncbi:MAG: hypothetical protein N3D11_09935 [Candidatus Sumerlaeia bacterium]|nr:hypothetical protein [Candidatus Sumerlaeia bacterium]